MVCGVIETSSVSRGYSVRRMVRVDDGQVLGLLVISNWSAATHPNFMLRQEKMPAVHTAGFNLK